MQDISNYFCTNPECKDYGIKGVGVRATARIIELDKDAVNRVILKAGEHRRRVLDNLLVQLGLTEIQLEEPTGKRGRPRNPQIIPHVDLDYATVHKTREKDRVVKVERKIVYGDAERINVRLEDSPSHIINTSYMERMNGILGQMDVHLKRKALTFAKSLKYFIAKLSLVIAAYNFVRPHGALSKNTDRSTTPRTPAMIAGITDYPWSFVELLGKPYVCNV